MSTNRDLEKLFETELNIFLSQTLPRKTSPLIISNVTEDTTKKLTTEEIHTAILDTITYGKINGIDVKNSKENVETVENVEDLEMCQRYKDKLDKYVKSLQTNGVYQ